MQLPCETWRVKIVQLLFISPGNQFSCLVSSQQEVASSQLSTPCAMIAVSDVEKPFTYSFCSSNTLAQESQLQIESLQIRSWKASQHPYRLEFISSHTVMLGGAFQKVNLVSPAFLSGREARLFTQKSNLAGYYIFFICPYLTLKVFQSQELVC